MDLVLQPVCRCEGLSEEEYGYATRLIYEEKREASPRFVLKLQRGGIVISPVVMKLRRTERAHTWLRSSCAPKTTQPEFGLVLQSEGRCGLVCVRGRDDDIESRAES